MARPNGGPRRAPAGAVDGRIMAGAALILAAVLAGLAVSAVVAVLLVVAAVVLLLRGLLQGKDG